MLKRIGYFFLIFIQTLIGQSNFAFGQNYLKVCKYYDQWEVGLSVGTSMFFGDIAEYENPFKKEFKEYSYGANLIIEKRILPVLSVGFVGSSVKLTGLRDYFKTGNKAFQSFNTQLRDICFITKLDIAPILLPNSTNFSIYGVGGIGSSYFRSIKSLTLNNQFVSAIGYEKNGTVKSKMANALSYPFGFGFGYNVRKNIFLNVNFCFTLVNSDEVDANIGITSNKDFYTMTGIGVSYRMNLRKKAPIKKVEPEILKLDSNLIVENIDTVLKTNDDFKDAKIDTIKNHVSVSDTNKSMVKGVKFNSIVKYKLQLSASRSPIDRAQLNQQFNIHEPISEQLHSDGWYRYTIGDFTNACDAINLRKKIGSNSNNKDLFVVPYIDGERVLPNIYSELLQEKNYFLSPQHAIDFSGDAKVKLTKAFYSIQIAASKKRIGIPIFCFSEDINGDLIEFKSGKYYRYALGTFSNINDAEYRLKEIRKTICKDAYIIGFYNNQTLNLKNVKEILK